VPIDWVSLRTQYMWRRFLINLQQCRELKLFADEGKVLALLKAWVTFAEGSARSSPEAMYCGLREWLCADEERNGGAHFAGRPIGKDPKRHYSRITLSGFALFDDRWGLFDRDELSKRGITEDALRRSRSVSRAIGEFNATSGAAEMVYKESASGSVRSVRGARAFAWATETTRLEAIAPRAASPDAEVAAIVVDTAGLPYSPDTVDLARNMLVVLDYPPESGTHHRAFRATAVEGVGNPFFKARGETEPAALGFTLNLIQAQANAVPFDGVTEVVIEPMPFATDFGWRAIGVLELRPVFAETTDIDIIIAGRPRDKVDALIDAAIDWIVA
jgi:hypothetical protein